MLTLDVDVVDENGEILDFLGTVHLVDILKVALVDLAVANHVDGQIHIAVNQPGIGDDVIRHGIEDDVIVAVLQIVNHPLEVITHQQIGGIGRNGSHGNHVEIGIAQNTLVHHLIQVGELAREVSACTIAHAVEAGILTETALAEVEVDGNHFLACVRKAQCHVHSHKTLPFARHGGRELYHHAFLLFAAFTPHEHEVEVGTYDAERLGDAVMTGLGDHNLLVGLVLFFPWQLSDDGNVDHFLNVVAGVDAVVQRIVPEQGVENQRRQQQAQQQPHHHDARRNGRYGRRTARCAFDDFGIGLGDGKLKRILFTLVEQVKIQLLFDFLLAGNLGNGLLLRRDGNNASRGHALLRAGLSLLHLEGVDVIRQAAHDVALHRGQLVAQVDHHRILAARGRCNLLIAEHHLVVLGYLALHPRVGDSGIAGDKVGARHLAYIVVDISCQCHLHTHLGGITGRAHHVGGIGIDGAAGSVHLQGGHLAVNTAQVFRQSLHTVGDKGLGAAGHQVLIIDGVLVVAGNHGVEHIDTLLVIVTAQGQLHHIALLVGTLGSKASHQLACHRFGSGNSHNHLVIDVPFGLEILGLGDGNRAILRVHLIAKVSFFPPSVAIDLELKVIATFGHHCDGEALSDLPERSHLQRRALVEAHIAQKHMAIVLDVGSQRIHHVLHEFGRTDFVTLVGDKVHTRADTKVGKRLRLGSLVAVFGLNQNECVGRIAQRLRFRVQIGDAAK